MVSINRKRIRCLVVAVPVEAEAWSSRGALAHDLVPGADPYVAQLIERLQDEVRRERRADATHARHRLAATREHAVAQESLRPRLAAHSPSADLEIPWYDVPVVDDPLGDGEESLPDFGDASDDPLPAW